MLQKKFDGNLQDLFGMFIAYKDEKDEEDGESSIKGLDTIEDLKKKVVKPGQEESDVD